MWRPPTPMQKLIMGSVLGIRPEPEPPLFLEPSPIPKPADPAALAMIEQRENMQRRC